MNQEYEFRKNKAWEIDLNISELVNSVLIVGSVAYNSEGVVKPSDLDMIAICDFLDTDFYDIYDALDVTPNPVTVRLANALMTNVHKIVWETNRFKTGLFLWDKTAFERVLKIDGVNRVFAGPRHSKPSLSAGSVEVLWNLHGQSKPFFKEKFAVPGGDIVEFHPYYEDETEFYIGIQSSNLLLDPVLLSDKDGYFMSKIAGYEDTLQNKLRQVYGSDSDAKLSKAVPPKVYHRMPNNLKNYLDNIFG